MGKKLSTVSLNLYNNKDWYSSWYVHKEDFSKNLQVDLLLYSFFRSQIINTDNFEIIRVRSYRINHYIIIDLDIFFLKINNNIVDFLINMNKTFGKKNYLLLVINKLTHSFCLSNGYFLAIKIAKLIERRIKFRSKTIKMLLKKSKQFCKGIHVLCSGRINNVDMARTDNLYIGSVPLQSKDIPIDFGFTAANTIKGLLSIKVWVYK